MSEKRTSAGAPKLYGELASWYHLVTHPRSYAGEARFAAKHLGAQGGKRRLSVLELGSGGGGNAFHLKKRFDMTLSDLSPAMIEQSRRINPECEHIVGDMRTLRLRRTFDAVFVHDAIGYMTSERDLARAIKTSAAHCRPGGVVFIQPDFVRETFEPGTSRGGHSENGRSARYVESQRARTTGKLVDVDFTFTLKDKSGTRVVHDRHVVGLFPRATWITLLRANQFRVRRVVDPWKRECFIATRA
jgi:SAM-dependent methyltransferase